MTPDDCDDCGWSDRGVCGEHLAQAREDAAYQGADEAWGVA